MYFRKLINAGNLEVEEAMLVGDCRDVADMQTRKRTVFGLTTNVLHCNQLKFFLNKLIYEHHKVQKCNHQSKKGCKNYT